MTLTKMCSLTIAAVMMLAPEVSAQSSGRDITQVEGDVYRARSNTHYSLVVATTEGTVVVDPLNSSASSWLSENVSSVSDQPVTHLIYSHSHFDHASGGQAFDGAQVIAHANAPESLDGVSVDVRFDDTYEFELGGKTFELTYVGPGHGDDLIVVVVRPENVAFVVDIAAPRRFFWNNFGGANMDNWYQQLLTVEALDFDILAPGHGNVGVKADLEVVRVYMEELRAEVLAGLKEGKSGSQLADEMTMEDKRDWQQYDSWRASNVTGMADFLVRDGQVE